MRIKLKEVIKLLHLNQKEFAEMVGLSEAYISYICNNKLENIPFETFEMLCMTLKMTPNDLIELPDFEE